MNKKIYENMNNRNLNLAPYACKDSEAYRFFETKDDDIRTPFFRDVDRIIYSLSYTRYMDKTQVFTFNDNDHISKRMTHVQMVSKIARTIGRALNLNEDLIEAAALGHDLGHVPFGHVGERILSQISLENGEGYFNHNIQSVRDLMYVENNGNGSNLTIQVLDGIMCHNGELELQRYEPNRNKTKDDFLREYENSYKDKSFNTTLIPMTLEGCVVRISDIISYIGKDVEDAIRLGMIKEDDIPISIRKVLGTGNSQIIDTVVHNLLENSIGKDYLSLDDEIFTAIKELKKFNYEYIYNKANSKEMLDYYEKVFRTVFNTMLKNVKENNRDSDIFKNFLDTQCEKYLDNTSDERKVIDYIAGMTDDYIVKQFNTINKKTD